jgi:hypothetical protein
MGLTIFLKLNLDYSFFVSTFHTQRLTTGASWTMPSLDTFIEALIQDQDKLIKMGVIKKSPKLMHLLHMMATVLNIRNPKRKAKKRHMHNKKRKGTPNPSMTRDPKVEKGRKDRSVPTTIEDFIQNLHA